METRYPIRKEDGKDFANLNEVLELLSKEKHGQWLVGNNSMWHGGLHISPLSAPHSKIERHEDAASAVPLQCIAGGKVVACRLHDTYLEGQYGDATLQYSSAFLLVQSIHKPATDSKTWLTFYTLYMHLAPLSTHPKIPVYKVTERGNGLRMRKYQGDEAAGQEAPAVMSGKLLKKEDRVFVERQESFVIKGKNGAADKTEIFGLMLKVDDANTPENRFWASVRSEYVTPDGEAYAYLPKWMTTVIAQGGSNGSMFKPATPFDIEAGEAVGFMGKDDAPGNIDQSTGVATYSLDWFAHIEVLSSDPNMPAFLSNPGELKTGSKYILIKAGQPLYQCDETGNTRVYQPTGAMTSAEAGKIIAAPESQKNAGVTWFKIGPDSWVNQDGVEQLTQHDLTKLKFTALEQSPTRNFQQTLDEAWISDAFRLLSESISPERDLECSSLCDYYSRMADVLDKNRDGKISAEEMAMYYQSVLQGVRSWNDEPGMLLRRLIVKHESEWFGGKDHPRWASLLEKVPENGKPYLEKWLDDHEWMSQVPEFNNDNPVWHFHPVEFLSIVGSKNKINITVEMLYKVFEGLRSPARIEFLTEFAKEINENADVYKLDTLRRVNHFFAQVRQEMGGDASPIESLNYSEEGLKTQFRYFRLHPEEAKTFSYKKNGRVIVTRADEVAIADRVYADRFDNGDRVLGNGSKYRGRGAIHLTGLSHYRSFSDYYSLHWDDGVDFVDSPEKLEEAKYCVRSAIYFWLSESLYLIADEGDSDAIVSKITAKVNFYTNSYEARQKNYARILSGTVFDEAF